MITRHVAVEAIVLVAVVLSQAPAVLVTENSASDVMPVVDTLVATPRDARLMAGSTNKADEAERWRAALNESGVPKIARLGLSSLANFDYFQSRCTLQ